MKMEYVKPSILVERFTLSQNIAAACNAAADDSRPYGDPNTWNKNTCTWSYQGDILFTNTTTDPLGGSCNVVVGEGAEVGIICYNNPNPNLQLFGS